MRGSYKVTTPPATEPVTLAEARKHLNFTTDDPTDDDDYISLLIAAARSYCEEHTNRAFLTQTITHVLPGFPTTDPFRNPFGAIRLFRSPAIALTSITYRDEDDAPQTLDISGNDADVILDAISEPATVTPWITNMADGWPATCTDRPDAVTLVYTCGFASAGAVPKSIKQAILLMVGELYERRENFVKQLPTAVEHLLAPWIVREY